MQRPRHIYFTNGLLSVVPRKGSTIYVEGKRILAAKTLIDSLSIAQLAELTGFSEAKTRQLFTEIVGDEDEII